MKIAKIYFGLFLQRPKMVYRQGKVNGLVGVCLLPQPRAWCLLQVNCRTLQAPRTFKMRFDISLGAFVPVRWERSNKKGGRKG